jgi:hypothetical protein
LHQLDQHAVRASHEEAHEAAFRFFGDLLQNEP